MGRPFYVAIDFDGTVVDHQFPDIGSEVPGAFQWMRAWQLAGASLLLWTMRSDSEKAGPVLSDAVAFCRARGVEFAGVNTNPTQAAWTTSPKIYAHVYVDDAAACVPLRTNPRMGGRAFVDWAVVGPEVLKRIEAHFARQ